MVHPRRYFDPKKAPLAVRKRARQLLRERWDRETAAKPSSVLPPANASPKKS